MPARRGQVRRNENAITHDAADAFVAGDEAALHRALGLPPWCASPLDAEGECPWPAGSAGARSWPEVVRLRAELEAAARAR